MGWVVDATNVAANSKNTCFYDDTWAKFFLFHCLFTWKKSWNERCRSYLFGMLMLFTFKKTESSTDDSLSNHGLAPWLQTISSDEQNNLMFAAMVLQCREAHTDLLDGECWYVPYHWICLDLISWFRAPLKSGVTEQLASTWCCHFLRLLDQVEEGITIMEPRKIATWMRHKCNILSKEIWSASPDAKKVSESVAIGNWGEEIFENLVCHLAAYAPVKFFDSLPSASWKNVVFAHTWGSRLGGFGPRLGLTLRSHAAWYMAFHDKSTKVFTIIASDANSEVECQVFLGETAGEIYIPHGLGSGSGRADLWTLLRESIGSHQHEAVADFSKMPRVVRQVICIPSCWLKLARLAKKQTNSLVGAGLLALCAACQESMRGLFMTHGKVGVLSKACTVCN